MWGGALSLSLLYTDEMSHGKPLSLIDVILQLQQELLIRRILMWQQPNIKKMPSVFSTVYLVYYNEKLYSLHPLLSTVPAKRTEVWLRAI